jgi:hypothetical protein
MNTRTLGIVIVVIGIMMIVYTGFDFITTERLVDLGPVRIDKERNNFIQWPPVVGIVLLIGCIVTIAMDKRIRV